MRSSIRAFATADAGIMMNDECRMMNGMRESGVAAAAGTGHHSSFIIPHFAGGIGNGGA
jgi:hypothetical protein